MESCLDGKDAGDKDSSQAFTVTDPDRGAKGLHKGNERADVKEGMDLKVTSELGLGNMQDEEGEEADESTHLGGKLLFFALGPGLSWATRVGKGKRGHLWPQRAQTLISQGVSTQAAPRQEKEVCEVQSVSQGRALGAQLPGNACPAKRHLDSELIKNKQAGQAEPAGLDSPQLVISVMAPKFLLRGIQWIILALICAGNTW